MAAQPAADEKLTSIYTINVEEVLRSIGLRGSVPSCSSRGTFNHDFSKMAISAEVPGGVSHAVVIDMASGRATDLTAPRQGTGFSSGEPLKETAMTFESALETIRYTDRVIISSGTSTLLVDPADPKRADVFSPGHDVVRSKLTRPSGIDYDGHGRSVLSPDGRFIVSDRPGSTGYVLRIADSRARDLPVNCGGLPEGWRDANTTVVRGRDNFYLVPVDDNGTPGPCIAIFPSAERSFRSARLRLDGKALFVTVAGSRGEEHYMADLSSPGAEPLTMRPTLTMDRNWRVYHPRAA